jgi:D-serine deaminase-like pyridoxal phosphate-dependent protein
VNPFDGYEAALAEVNPPFAFVDLEALDRNLGRLVAVASGHGKLVRLATKSIRCLAVTRRALALSPDVRGLLTFTLAESLWLAGQGLEDLVVAYPTADTEALAALDRLDAEAPVLMVDSLAHVELIERHCRRRVPVCLEVDLSLWLAGGRVRLGPKRSPVRTVAQAVELARRIAARPGVELVGVMGYEGHVAGVGDRPRNPGRALAIQAMQRAARRDVARRRAELVAAIAEVTPLEFFNGGGTGSVTSPAAEAAVTEVTVGSGLYAPALFDHYRSLRLELAAYFVLPVVRRPRPGVATLLGGGYIASGAPGADRLPVVAHPAGLRLDRLEGAGEVQTPVLGAAAGTLHVGDRVYLRHAKAGELCERFDRLHLLSGGRVVDQVPTYRGEGRAFL